ncbi:MAG: hypothetical protein HQK51_18820 [Oligoflexia bacterium]|nr:hypothetical protein [Oligoflexia bacterium]
MLFDIIFLGTLIFGWNLFRKKIMSLNEDQLKILRGSYKSPEILNMNDDYRYRMEEHYQHMERIRRNSE